MTTPDDELAALTRGISAVDGQANPPPEPSPGLVPEKSSLDAAQAWAEIPESVGLIVTQFLPELRPVYSREACVEWGRHMSRVADKYGWTSDGLPPEIAALICSAGFVLPTVMTVKARKAVPPPEKVTNGSQNPAA